MADVLMDVSLHCDSERTTGNAQRYLTLFQMKVLLFSNFIETFCWSFLYFFVLLQKKEGMKGQVTNINKKLKSAFL
mgnify:CR=1 FL=1